MPWEARCSPNLNRKRFSVLQVQLGASEHRGSPGINTLPRIHRIETQSAEDIPSRHLPGIFIAEPAVRTRQIELVHDRVGPLLRLPWLAGVVVKVDHVVDAVS